MSGYNGFYHYLPVADRDMRFGLYVTGGGRGVIGPRQNYPPAQHPGVYQFSWRSGRELPEFQIILITDGRGQFESKSTGLIEIEGASLLLLFPGVWHRYRPLRNVGWTERWISLHGEFMHHLCDEHSLLSERAVLPLEDCKTAVDVFDRVVAVVHDNPTQHSPLLRLGALQLLTIAVDLTLKSNAVVALPKSKGKRLVDDPLVNEALDIIWTRSHRPLSVDQLVSQLPSTRRTLERRAKAVLGHSILDEINHCRLSRAKRLLAETNLPVKSIVYLAGFGSQERMRKLMAADEGCSPSEYRNRIGSGNREE